MTEAIVKFFEKRQNKVIAGVTLGVFIAALFFGKSFLIAATVNGKPISRLAIISDLEQGSGKAALDAAISKSLIFQEAKKQNIVITQQEIDLEIQKIESTLSEQGQELTALLASQGLTRNELGEQIRIQKIIEAVLKDKITVTEEEMQNFLDENKELLPEDSSQDELKESAKQQISRSKLEQNYQTWIASLKDAANIRYFVNY